ncbi:2916_t:CDS:2, partial [Funneliformis geosporum]
MSFWTHERATNVIEVTADNFIIDLSTDLCILLWSEFSDYRTPEIKPQLVVDNSRKQRLAQGIDEPFCGSCYGGEAPESGCCNTCDEVSEAYIKKGWSFNDPDSINQCVEVGWKEKVLVQSKEGCNVADSVRVNKVAGNFHLAPVQGAVNPLDRIGRTVSQLVEGLIEVVSKVQNRKLESPMSKVDYVNSEESVLLELTLRNFMIIRTHTEAMEAKEKKSILTFDLD